MSGVICRLGRTTLAARVLDEGTPPAWLASHVSRCLQCQAVVANSRRLRRNLSGLSTISVDDEDQTGGFAWVAAGAASLAAAAVVVRRRHGGD